MATRAYRISALPDVLDRLESVLSYMQMLGAQGASRSITIFCDGDGAVRIKVERVGGAQMTPSPKTNSGRAEDISVDLG
jgi:hypothetical protein